MRQAEADEERIEELQEKETYVEFLTKEISFNDELLTALRSLQAGNDSLDKAEELASERRIVAALLMLEGRLVRIGLGTGADLARGVEAIAGSSAGENDAGSAFTGYQITRLADADTRAVRRHLESSRRCQAQRKNHHNQQGTARYQGCFLPKSSD